MLPNKITTINISKAKRYQCSKLNKVECVMSLYHNKMECKDYKLIIYLLKYRCLNNY